MSNRRSVLAGLFGLGGLRVANAAGEHENAVFHSGLQLFFAQRDTVVSFNASNGFGAQAGRSNEGVITGTSITNFQLVPLRDRIKFDNRCLISDIDGDSIIFDEIEREYFSSRFRAIPQVHWAVCSRSAGRSERRTQQS